MSILAPQLPGSTVLDLFAGSGALGFEALSRGAAHVTLVEVSPAGVAALRSNAAALGVTGRVTIRRGDAMRLANRLPAQAFDIVLADPPFTTAHAATLVRRFQEVRFARILAVEHSARMEMPAGETRRYGDIALTFCYQS